MVQLVGQVQFLSTYANTVVVLEPGTQFFRAGCLDETSSSGEHTGMSEVQYGRANQPSAFVPRVYFYWVIN